MERALSEADAENAAFHRIIESIRHDLAETERLLALESVRRSLISTPEKLPYIRRVVINTRIALENVDKWSERMNTNRHEDTNISFDTGRRYLITGDAAFAAQLSEISTCHQALSTVLAFLTPLERLSVTDQGGPPEYQHATYFDDVLKSRQKQKLKRAATTNSSPSSIDILKFPTPRHQVSPPTVPSKIAHTYQREHAGLIPRQEDVKHRQAKLEPEVLLDKKELEEEAVEILVNESTFSPLIGKLESEFEKSWISRKAAASLITNVPNPEASHTISDHYRQQSLIISPPEPEDRPGVEHRSLSAGNLLGPLNTFDFSSLRDPILLADSKSPQTNHNHQDKLDSRLNDSKRHSDLGGLPARLQNGPSMMRNTPPSGRLISELSAEYTPSAPPAISREPANTPISPPKWKPYRRATEEDIPHTIESSQNPPPELYILPPSLPSTSTPHSPPPENPQHTPRRTYKSLTTWPSMQFYSQQSEQSYTPYHQTYQQTEHYPETRSQRSISVTSTPASTFSTISSLSQGSTPNLPDAYEILSIRSMSPPGISSRAVSNVSEMNISREQSVTAAEGRRNNRRALLNLMAKGNG
jgi:hypothetical protein